MAAPEPTETRKRRVLPIHPFLFAIFPVLVPYARNLDFVPLRQVLPLLGAALAVTLVVWGILLIITRKLRSAALATSAIVLPLFSYTHLLNVTPKPAHWLIGPLCIAGSAAAVWACLRSRKPLLDATAVLNLASLVLVIPSCWSIGVGFSRSASLRAHAGEGFAGTAKQGNPNGHPGTPSRRIFTAAPAGSTELPDIYYIVLDAYGRADRLKQFYGYDNSPFIRELERRGFYVAHHSRANYDQTPLCLASGLNFTYLDAVARKVGPNGSLEACRQMLDDNEAAAFLARRGYRYVYIGSGVSEANVETADLILNDAQAIPQFDGQVLPPGAGLTGAEAKRADFARYNEHRNRLLGVFQHLDTVADLPYRKFVFAHLLAPHPPFVLGASGEAVHPEGAFNFADASWLLQQITREQYITRYIAQLQYVNRRTLEAIDSILKKSRRPPIIIVQGDHGSRMNLDWYSLDKTDVREPFSILNAYYAPKKVRADLYDTISPVNSFRIVFNDMFGATYARLPDRSYYSTVDQPYAFTDVTSMTENPKDMAHASAGAGVIRHTVGTTRD